VYFGRDWTGDDSVEELFDTVELVDGATPAPEVAYLAPPEVFLDYLDRYRALREELGTEATDDEVTVDEDEEQILEGAELDRWRTFLSWLGVNRCLRPVHFHDVEEQRAGWLRTRGLVKPDGASIATISDRLWHDYRRYVDDELAKVSGRDGRVPYFYGLHDLEHASAVIAAAGNDKNGDVAEALFLHLARNWSYLEQFARLSVALIPSDRDPGKRTKPIRPLGDELHEIGMDFWMWRLRRRPIVPTSHGPRMPGRAWLPSPEIERRFGRRTGSADALIPVVRLPKDGRPRGRAIAFARVLGVREEFSPATFRVQDAEGLCGRIAQNYGPAVGEDSARLPFELADPVLRAVIRPAYRNLFELLVGAVERSKFDQPPLADALLLETDGAGRYRFRPGSQTLYQDRTGTRDRVGSVGGLWTFVLESTPSARAPLTRAFGARVLEEVIRWAPSAEETHLDEDDQTAFRAGLRALRPYVLARLRAERNEDAQARQDARRLDSFIARVSPVPDLTVACWLDDRQLTAGEPRDSYVDTAADGSVTGFVRWGEAGWPPTPRDAEALAGGLADVFQTSMFEPFLALINASSHEARVRLLRLAGAPTNLDDVLASADDEPETPSPEEPPSMSAPGADAEDLPASPPVQKSPVGRVPLWHREDLVLAGLPVLVRGEPANGQRSLHGGSSKDADNRGTGLGYGGQATDLEELNALGMDVTLAYESRRLGGDEASVVFDPLSPATGLTAAVFDVSTPEAVTAAVMASPRLHAAFEALSAFGIVPEWPGFDILTLDLSDGSLDRLIELKSSGVNASIQHMTWNEWKSARDSRIRERFWLYVAGNLRSDLAAARPFVRAIRDPFGSLLSTVVSAPVRRAVQLDVQRFDQSEFLELDVRAEVRT
jgi:hypothetical protein